MSQGHVAREDTTTYTRPTTPEKTSRNMRQQGSRRRWCPCQNALGHEHRFVRVSDNTNRTSETEVMWFRASFDCVPRVAPTSGYDDEEVEAFYMDLEKFYEEGHTFKVFVGEFNAKIGS
ncbi:unnamed protein product [Heligmosomoides polygyrus]|uniref:Uncharacterized protein n=1 Tax=Heligmosomoides polygyrus TaxID=6339 RepID=A0A3P7UPA5_HELPZ|nr:unnamed protein product [Heligmosomoides polygyrus]